jgi:hypothetical protein
MRSTIGKRKISREDKRRPVMSIKNVFQVGLFFIFVLLLSSCGSGGEGAAKNSGIESSSNMTMQQEGQAESGLQISGMVNSPSILTVQEMDMMEMVEVQMANSNGDETSYKGVPIIVVLGMAGVQDTATELVFRTADGMETKVLLQELNACINCIVSIGENGGFEVVLPGINAQTNLSEVVELILN